MQQKLEKIIEEVESLEAYRFNLES